MSTIVSAYFAGDNPSLGEWVTAIVTTVGAVSAAIVSIIVAIKTGHVQRDIKTGNGKTIGEAVEATHQKVADARVVTMKVEHDDQA